jgi:hypothetical protein
MTDGAMGVVLQHDRLQVEVRDSRFCVAHVLAYEHLRELVEVEDCEQRASERGDLVRNEVVDSLPPRILRANDSTIPAECPHDLL